MKIGMVTDFIGHFSFTEMLDTTQRLGVKGVEFNAATGRLRHILTSSNCWVVQLSVVNF
jgi:hypothetical protein